MIMIIIIIIIIITIGEEVDTVWGRVFNEVTLLAGGKAHVASVNAGAL